MKPRLLLRCDRPAHARQLLAAAGETVSLRDADTLEVLLAGQSAGQLNRFLVGHGIEVHHLAREHASLESLFFDLTGDPALEAAA